MGRKRKVSKRHNVKGFTIVELLIVVIIIAILAAIVFLAYTGAVAKSKTSKSLSSANEISKKAEIYKAFGNTYPTFAQLTADPPIDPSAALTDKTKVYWYPAYTLQSRDVNNYQDGRVVVVGETNFWDGTTTTVSGLCIYYWDYTANIRAYKTVGQASCYQYP